MQKAQKQEMQRGLHVNSILTWFYLSHKPLVILLLLLSAPIFPSKKFFFLECVPPDIYSTSTLPHCWRFELAKPVIYICLGPPLSLFNSRSNKVSEQRQAVAGFTSFLFLHAMVKRRNRASVCISSCLCCQGLSNIEELQVKSGFLVLDIWFSSLHLIFI